MEKTLSINQSKAFNKVRSKKWYLPLLFYLTLIICIAGIVLSMTRPMTDLPDKWAFFTGCDVLGLGVCAAMLKGCLAGKDSGGDMTLLFASMIFSVGCLLFLDECTALMQDIGSLRALNVIVNMLIFVFMPFLIYFFWRYIRCTLELDSFLKPWIIKLLQTAIIPVMAIDLLNPFFPVYFSVSEEGVTHYEPFCIIPLAYAATAAIAVLRGMKHSKISKTHKSVIKMFFGVPLICSFFSLSLFGAVLLSIVLLYVVIYTEKSNTLSATQHELGTAANIQLSSLPTRFPKRREITLFASMDPAKEVGGDFYDFFEVDDDHLALVMADVSGKGVPAALFMMRSKTIIKLLARSGISPAQVLSEANAAIMESNSEDMFVTVWLGVLELSSGILTFADAGHEKPMLFRNGKWELLEKEYIGFAVGMLDPDELEEMPPKHQYTNQQIKLEAGDVLFQYTDGVTEATNTDDKLFGEERLVGAANDCGSTDPKELLPYIRGNIDEFVGEAPQFDDLTMLCLRYNGTSGGQVE